MKRIPKKKKKVPAARLLSSKCKVQVTLLKMYMHD